jgi:CBS domain-containing protein
LTRKGIHEVRDLMTPDIEVVTPRDTLSTAARLMAELGFEAIPVADNNKLVGLISAHDLSVRIAVDGSGPEATAVRQAMTTDLLYCFENESADDVAQKMAEWWVRRLPVVNPEKRLIGMISLADLTALNATPRPGQSRTPPHQVRSKDSARQTPRTRRTAATA